ncbi:hypothetical protein V5O48_002491 [Marasmius crinis-equi]|uniref:Tyrosinase copper-binding domain-containing protein n=1 Tax=Marasmius crinis-equi TaxID=585013 RepID=A0ABR3FVG0_9AGAR
MKLFTSAFLALLSLEVLQTAALPSPPATNSTYPSSCSSPVKRREWRTLSNDEKLAYTDAVKCLQALPSTAGIMQEATSRFEDFAASHIVLTDEIHMVGQFFPWHRWYLYLYEKALKEECGYKGVHPYWDWTLDVTDDLKSYAASPVFDPTYGFGGNGADTGTNYTGVFGNATNVPGFDPSLSTGGGCITDGPFASYIASVGPGRSAKKHCLERGFNGSFLYLLTAETIANILDQKTFWTGFHYLFDGWPTPPRPMRPHGAGHLMVGGDMGSFYSGPVDPLFFVYHGYLDKVWWEWQNADPKERLYLIDGPTTIDPPYEEVTLDFLLKTEGLAPLTPVRQVMDTGNDLLCYTYE